MEMARSQAQPIKCEKYWRLANQKSVQLPSLERKLRKNALFLNQSAFSNFALYVIMYVIPVLCNQLKKTKQKKKPNKHFSTLNKCHVIP